MLETLHRHLAWAALLICTVMFQVQAPPMAARCPLGKAKQTRQQSDYRSLSE